MTTSNGDVTKVKYALLGAENELLHRAVERERGDADLFGDTLCDLARAGVIDGMDCPEITGQPADAE